MTTTSSEPFVFTPAVAVRTDGAADQTDRLVNETRREISEFVREVAVAVRSDRNADEFFGLLVDRIQRAMGAEGVVIWQADRPLRRIGRVTDQSIPNESIGTHRYLLAEVAAAGQPVVVPATPGATDPDVPANPTPLPVALVPIELEPAADAPSYLIEVFLEPACGVATQRGYLRFVAQMADLAAEFLRGDQLRNLRRRQRMAEEVDRAAVALHQLGETKRIEVAVVDAVAEIFGFDRVGLCVGQPPRVVAVSHVEVVNHRAAAAAELQQAAGQRDIDSILWHDDAEPTSEGLVVRAVAPLGEQRRIVCMQIADVEPVHREHQPALNCLLQHATLALDHAQRFEAIPGGRLIASLGQRGGSVRGGRRRKFVGAAMLMMVIAVAALIPVPLVVSAPAVIRPDLVQTITAPRDAVVDQIHVTHGQVVASGDRLLTLVDRDLEEQITTLIGRRAVLVQQQTRWTEAMVDTASHQLDRMERVQGESRLVAEEIQSVDSQLAVLGRAAESLEIRASRDGVVDAWQIQHRLQSRPLRRGDSLLRVIAVDSPWTADAEVVQSRIGHLQQADQRNELSISVALDSQPTKTYKACLHRIGPAVRPAPEAPPATAVLVSLDQDANRILTVNQRSGDQAGAPARVVFDCGSAAAAYVLFQDVLRSVRGSAALYLGNWNEGEG